MGSRHLGGSRNGQDARCPSIHATGETPVVPVRPCGRAKWRLRRNGNYGIIQNARGKVSVCAKRRDDDEPDKREETSPCRGRGCIGAFACFGSRSPACRRRRHLPQRLLDAHERGTAARRPLDVVRLRSEHPALHQLLGWWIDLQHVGIEPPVPGRLGKGVDGQRHGDEFARLCPCNRSRTRFARQLPRLLPQQHLAHGLRDPAAPQRVHERHAAP